MKTRVNVLVLLLVARAVVGCGSAQPSTAARESTTPTRDAAATRSTEESARDPRAEIERLDREIQRRTAAVPPPPPAASPATPEPAPEGEATEGPPSAPGVAQSPDVDAVGTCERACQATGSICQAARRICFLASEMDDAWATGRCTAATRTCQDTRRRATNQCGPC